MGKSSFTVSHSSLSRMLVTPCGVTEAYDPNEDFGIHEIKNCTALWDTGATSCVLSKQVIQDLKLQTVGMTKNVTAGGVIDANRYLVNLTMPDGVIIPSVRATEADLRDFDILIGMDIITRGDFAVTQKDGKTKFSFQMPSTHDIDFVKESEMAENGDTC